MCLAGVGGTRVVDDFPFHGAGCWEPTKAEERARNLNVQTEPEGLLELHCSYRLNQTDHLVELLAKPD